MLLVMMVTFFTPTSAIQQPHKVVRAHDYYLHKLQVSSKRSIDCL